MQTSPIEVRKALKDVDYPVKKKELMQHAKKHGANEDVMEVLEGLPDKEYNSPIEVSEEFHGKQSHRRNKSSSERESSRGNERNK